MNTDESYILPAMFFAAPKPRTRASAVCVTHHEGYDLKAELRSLSKTHLKT